MWDKNQFAGILMLAGFVVVATMVFAHARL